METVQNNMALFFKYTFGWGVRWFCIKREPHRGGKGAGYGGKETGFNGTSRRIAGPKPNFTGGIEKDFSVFLFLFICYYTAAFLGFAGCWEWRDSKHSF